MQSENPTTFEETLKSGKPLIYKTKGTSMEPFLRQDRDIVMIQPKKEAGCRFNDVVLYIRWDGEYVLHRILKVKDGSCWIAGDSCFYGEDVREDQIIGVLSAVTRKNREFTVDNFLYRLYVLIWCDILMPFRMAFGRVYMALKAKSKNGESRT